jgi:hypothetical protein
MPDDLETPEEPDLEPGYEPLEEWYQEVALDEAWEADIEHEIF